MHLHLPGSHLGGIVHRQPRPRGPDDTVLALGEMVGDQLPKTPSRKVPVQFGTRIVMGALCGAAIAAPGGQLVIGLLAGVLGAVIGTLGGAAARARLAQAFGRDLPAGLIEDAVALVGAWLIVSGVR